MTANNSKFYLSYFNKPIDQYNHNYHHCIGKKPINSNYSVLTEKKLRRILQLLSLNLEKELVKITKYKIFIIKVTQKTGQEKYSLLIFFWTLVLGGKKLKM